MNIIQTKVFNSILNSVRNEIKKYNINSFKTKKGNTQLTERTYIEFIREILVKENYTFKEAGTQQPYDFRIEMEDNSTLLLEIKKTDTNIVYFNDTCPSVNAYYIIIYTGKQYKSKTKMNILPCVFGINGNDFINDDFEWLEQFKRELVELKEKYKFIGKNMSVYPRPTYKSNIQFLIDKYYDESKIVFDT